jgi:hypothetical protein
MKLKDPMHRFINGRMKYKENWLNDGNGVDLLTGKDMIVEKLTPKNMPEINGDFYYINKYTINIKQSDYQRITVTHKGKEYTDSLEITAGDSIEVKIEPLNVEDNNGAFIFYNVGELSYKGGTPNNSMTISATPATLNKMVVGFIPLNAPWSPDSGERLYDLHPQQPVASIRRKKITFPKNVNKVRVYFAHHYWGDERGNLRAASNGINQLSKVSIDFDFFNKMNYDLRNDPNTFVGKISNHWGGGTGSALNTAGLHYKVDKDSVGHFAANDLVVMGFGLTDTEYHNWFNTDYLSWGTMPINTFKVERGWYDIPYTTIGITPGKLYDLICFCTMYKSRTYGFYIYYGPEVTEEPKYYNL